MIKPGTPLGPTELYGLRRFIAFTMSNSEIGGKNKKSPDKKVE
jgi:hypothetical protein